MFLASNAPPELWAEAVAYATYIQNRSLSRTRDITPYEAIHGVKPDVSNLYKFGLPAFIHVPDCKRHKWEAKAVEGIFVGCDSNTKGFRVWIPSQRKVEISRNVIIIEDEAEKSEKEITLQTNRSTPFDFFFTEDELLQRAEEDLQPPDEILPPAEEVLPPAEEMQVEAVAQPPAEVMQLEQVEPVIAAPLQQQQQNPPAPRRSSRTPAHTEEFLEWRASLRHHHANFASPDFLEEMLGSDPNAPYEPPTYKKAMECEDKEKWHAASNEEMNSLNEKGTLSKLVPRPIDRKVIKCKWVFKVKPAYNGVEKRYKARLVACGYSQEPGVDFDKTYAPTLMTSSYRTILAIAAEHKLHIAVLDIKNAFLNATLKELIYIEQPEGFVVKGREDDVHIALKSLYGLVQAPLEWNGQADNGLQEHGLTRSEVDRCVYYKICGNDILIVGLFVDDIFVAGSTRALVDGVHTSLSRRFEMRCLPATRFIGLDIHHNTLTGDIFINQPDAVNKVIRQFNMSTCHPVATPADPSIHLSVEMSPTTEEEREYMAKVPYRKAVGCLLYLALTCRSDIIFAVIQLAKHCEKPGKGHWQAVKRVIAYLAGTPDYGILFKSRSRKVIEAFSDADFCGCVDTCRSTSGYAVFVYGSLAAYSTRLQKCNSQSTTESEYVAVAECVKEVLFIKNLVEELSQLVVGPITVHCENQSAIRLIQNPENHLKTKHIAVKYHLTRKLQEEGVIDVVYINTKEQTADIFTKPLPRVNFEKMRNQLGVVQKPVW
jgi:hypothetical protein